MQKKKCTGCEETNINEFTKNATTNDGFQYTCKTCAKVTAKKYYLANKDKINNYAKKYQKENKEKYTNYQKQFKINNPSYAKEYYKANREHLIAKQIIWNTVNNPPTGKSIATHHGTGTRLYTIYMAMKTRCYNSNSFGYKWYGGKGVVVCAEWLEDFAVFRDWANSTGYEEHLTIDRILSDGNYAPTNCQWLTRSENARKAQVDLKLKSIQGELV